MGLWDFRRGPFVHVMGKTEEAVCFSAFVLQQSTVHLDGGLFLKGWCSMAVGLV